MNKFSTVTRHQNRNFIFSMQNDDGFEFFEKYLKNKTINSVVRRDGYTEQTRCYTHSDLL